MPQHLALACLLVRDYDEAISFYVDTLGFSLEADRPMPEQNKRWVVVRPPGSAPLSPGVLLARAANEHQLTRVGDQTGGRVFLFLHTDDFHRDYEAYKARGVVFVREPAVESYGTVAVFQDLYGNLWDLVEPSASGRSA
jgi:catechol 2,3-dioxygenase-like lactoylglutathione lyase family enzyme